MSDEESKRDPYVGGRSIVDLLRQGDADFDFDPPHLGDDIARPASLD